MKPGARAVGVAESYVRDAEESTLGGVVCRADRTVDGCAFASCTVGGTDLTDSVATVYDRLDREDVSYVFVAGVALAWYNLLAIERLAERVERPVIAVTFEDSSGLEGALREAFDGDALSERLERYRSLPERHATTIDGHDLYYRVAGVDATEAVRVLEHFTAEGGRPEPLRVARFVARAGDDLRRE